MPSPSAPDPQTLPDPPSGDPPAAGPAPHDAPPAQRRKGFLHYAGFALRIGIPLIVIAVVWREVARLDSQRTWQIVRASDWHFIVAAIAASFLSIAAMGAYDVFAFRSTPALPPLRRWGRACMIFAWTNFLTLGPLGGPAVRLYLYRRAGMSLSDILRGIVRLYIAFFAGLTAWLAAVFAPVHGPLEIPARIAIATALAPLLALLAAAVLYRIRPTASGPWPQGRTALLGLVGVVDWGAALAAFALTARALNLPAGLDDLAKTLYLGQFVGMASMVPGGLGSADAVWLNMLAGPGVPSEAAAAQVLLFRLAFYIAPWATSLLLLIVLIIIAQARAGLQLLAAARKEARRG